MNTSAPAASKKARKPKPRYVVELDGVPCGRVSYPIKGIFGRKLIPGGGTLVKRPEHPEYFKGQKSAAKAISRAVRLRDRLTQSVCEVAENHRPFAEPGEYVVKPVNLAAT